MKILREERGIYGQIETREERYGCVLCSVYTTYLSHHPLPATTVLPNTVNEELVTINSTPSPILLSSHPRLFLSSRYSEKKEKEAMDAVVALSDTIPHYTTLYNTIQHNTTLYHTIPHYITLYCSAKNGYYSLTSIIPILV